MRVNATIFKLSTGFILVLCMFVLVIGLFKLIFFQKYDFLKINALVTTKWPGCGCRVINANHYLIINLTGQN